jgi:hypothetical protein
LLVGVTTIVSVEKVEKKQLSHTFCFGSKNCQAVPSQALKAWPTAIRV